MHVGGAVMLNDSSESEESPISRALEVAMKRGNSGEETILEIFRNVYRSSWTRPFVRHALANCSNIIARVRYGHSLLVIKLVQPSERR